MTIRVLGLAHLATAELGCGDRAAARATLARARDIVDDEPVTPFATRTLSDGGGAGRADRGPIRAALGGAERGTDRP